ncbi:MAG: sugar fermentation stimulation protein A [Pseudohongiellaceae bacterium]|jgi:sugar fermentation stimulation protein A
MIKGGLERALLIKRYKRFLADVETSNGEVITIHCPNTGAMTNCQEAGSSVWYSTSENPKRKYPNTWELVQAMNGPIIGINTGLANHLVREALEKGVISQLNGYSSIRSEVKYGDQNSRIDFLVEYPNRTPTASCYVEVKNVSLCIGNGEGVFPDAQTLRGQKHLQELMTMRSLGHRAVLIFCVQHSAITSVAPADAIDPEYGRLLRQAKMSGVEILAYQAKFDIPNSSIQLCTDLPVML